MPSSADQGAWWLSSNCAARRRPIKGKRSYTACRSDIQAALMLSGHNFSLQQGPQRRCSRFTVRRGYLGLFRTCSVAKLVAGRGENLLMPHRCLLHKEQKEMGTACILCHAPSSCTQWHVMLAFMSDCHLCHLDRNFQAHAVERCHACQACNPAKATMRGGLGVASPVRMDQHPS